MIDGGATRSTCHSVGDIFCSCVYSAASASAAVTFRVYTYCLCVFATQTMAPSFSRMLIAWRAQLPLHFRRSTTVDTVMSFIYSKRERGVVEKVKKSSEHRGRAMNQDAGRGAATEAALRIEL